MKEFDTIYLSWRKGQGGRRILVGKLEQDADGKFAFTYDLTAVEQAKAEGFAPYTEFPDVSKSYNGNVLDIFGQRLMKSERPDIQSFYRFWEIETQFQQDKFYLLGHTQGLLPTDNFEFLAEYNLVEGLHFVTEIASLSLQKLSVDCIKVGDQLRFELEPTNQYDEHAVKVLKGDLLLGYVKKVHCKLFHQKGADKIKLTVKAIDKNGVIKKIFMKVSL